MSRNSERKAREATKHPEYLGSTNQDDADRQVEVINEQLDQVDRAFEENAEQERKQATKGNKQSKSGDKKKRNK